MVILRVVHIVAGVFWAGSAIFLASIVDPTLKALGPQYQRPVMGALAPKIALAVGGSAVVTIAAGVWLTLKLRGGHLDTFYDTGWGYAITIGAVAAVVALMFGTLTGVNSVKMGELGKAVGEGRRTPEQGAEIAKLGGRLTMMGRTTAVLVVIAVASMASARFA